MSYSGLVAMFKGIANFSDSNDASQFTAAQGVISSVIASFGLTSSVQKTAAADNRAVFLAAIDPRNQTNPIPAQTAQETQVLHANQGDAQMGVLNTVIASQKSQAELLGQDVGKTFLIMEPMVELLKAVTQLLRVI